MRLTAGLYEKGEDLRAAYQGFHWRGRVKATDAVRQKPRFQTERDRVLGLWQDATDEERAVACVLLATDAPSAQPPIVIDGETIDVGILPSGDALKVVAFQHIWAGMSPDVAEEYAEDIRTTLGLGGYDITDVSLSGLIAAQSIQTKRDAFLVGQRFAELSAKGQGDTVLGEGLLRALQDWLEWEAFGEMTPAAVKGARKKACMTQDEFAREIGVTTRQFLRYEHGQTAVSRKIAERIHAVGVG